jgi:hypothetical protein
MVAGNPKYAGQDRRPEIQARADVFLTLKASVNPSLGNLSIAYKAFS